MSLTRKTKTVKLFLDLFEKKNGAISIIELVDFQDCADVKSKKAKN